jgi:hypothetical protein
LALQVSVFWKLVAYYVNTKYADRQILFLNMDETSIPYTMTHLPGCVAVEGTRLPRMAVRKQDMRGALTYVSVVCDMQHIQGKLPHYLFGSETKLTKKLLKGQHALPQTCLRVIRQKSAWTSSKNISMIVKDLAGVLKSWPDLQAILLLDVASPHLAKEVMEAVNDAVDGQWIADSEERVRDLSAQMRRKVFERALQERVDAAEAAFPPSASSNDRQATGE